MSVTTNTTAPGVRNKKLRFPSAFTVLGAVTVAVWLLAFIVPTGQYALDDKSGRLIPANSGQLRTR